MWLPIRPEDSEIAIEFARGSVHGTYNRMGYQTDTPRIFHIYVGKIAEQIVYRYLREELRLDITEAPPTTHVDEFDFTVKSGSGKTMSGDVKSVHVYLTWNNQVRKPEEAISQSWALVPVDQYRGRPKDLYIFPIVLGDSVEIDGNRYWSDDAGICFMSWATYADVSDWDFIPRGKNVYPYNRTRTDNYGREISECRIIEDLPDYLAS